MITLILVEEKDHSVKCKNQKVYSVVWCAAHQGEAKIHYQEEGKWLR